MKSAVPHQVIETTTPNLDGFEITRRPLIGFGLLISSVIGTLAVLIFFGAWASSNRIENRALAAVISETQWESEWWEDGLVFACPLH
jgi:hypothetical protein